MFIKQEVSQATVIIGLGCHDMTVADDVATLYKQGFAPTIVFSGNAGRMTSGLYELSEARTMMMRAVELGVPEDAILLEEHSTNTGENLRMTQSLLRQHNIDSSSVILVHKPYMLRRDYATFMKQWVGADQTEMMCWAGDVAMTDYLKKGNLDPHETIEVMVGDLQRVREYPKLGFQIHQSIPADVWDALESLISRGYDTQLLK